MSLSITGAMRCPIAAIEVILDLASLYIVVDDIAKSTIFRMVKKGTIWRRSQFSEADQK